jgi:RNA-directed DNA polymerase
MTAVSGRLFKESYVRLCESRKHYPDTADIWELRRRGKDGCGRLMRDFADGKFRFGIRAWVMLPDGRETEITDARDALAERVLCGILQNILAPVLSERCFHLKERGGLKAATREVIQALDRNEFVFRTDVKSYYASVNHGILWDKLRKQVYAAGGSLPVHPNIIMNYVGQWLCRVVEKNGIYEEMRQGIPTASSLSPLMGGFYLAELDRKAEKLPLFYVRYMDDILMMSEKRERLKKGIRTVKQEFEALKLAGHPDKTFVGRKEKGFDFLGYHFDPDGRISVSEKTLANFLRKTREIERREPPETREKRLQDYTLRRIRWAKAGLK